MPHVSGALDRGELGGPVLSIERDKERRYHRCKRLARDGDAKARTERRDPAANVPDRCAIEGPRRCVWADRSGVLRLRGRPLLGWAPVRRRSVGDVDGLAELGVGAPPIDATTRATTGPMGPGGPPRRDAGFWGPLGGSSSGPE